MKHYPDMKKSWTITALPHRVPREIESIPRQEILTSNPAVL